MLPGLPAKLFYEEAERDDVRKKRTACVAEFECTDRHRRQAKRC